MSEPAQPDPEPDLQEPLGDLFAYGRAAKAERQRALYLALAGGAAADVEPTDLAEARARLDQLEPETLAVVVDYLAAIAATAEQETGPEPVDTITAARAARAGTKRALTDALSGSRPRPPEDEPRGSISMDGGARASVPPPPPTHGEQLVELIRSRAADRGARL